MARKALGRLFDIGTSFAPVDINTADGATGKRISMAPFSGLTFVFFGGVGGAEDLVLDLQEHTASTGGTTRDLDVVTEYFIKAEAALDNDESWVRVPMAAASEVTVVGATYGAQQKIVAFYVGADQLSDDCSWVSVVCTCTTATAQLAGGLYIGHDLAVQRTPTNLPNLLLPGAANA